MQKYFYSGLLSLVLLGVIATPSAHAETATNEATMAKIQALMTQIAELQKQMASLKSEVKEIIKNDIAEGTSGDDVKKIQELLATDKDIYPEGLTTGYFGPRTKEAIKKFQTRHNLTVTGTVDAETKALLEEYLKERHTNGKLPEGLLRAPGISKKFMDRMHMDCDEHDHEMDDNRGKGKGKEKMGMGMGMGMKMGHMMDMKSGTGTKESCARHGKDHEDMMDDDHKMMHNKMHSGSTTMKLRSSIIIEMLSKANRQIREVENRIEVARGDTSKAEELITDAKESLDAARAANSARKLEEAHKALMETMHLTHMAKDALQNLNKGSSDDEEEDDDSDEDDEDEDEDEDDN